MMVLVRTLMLVGGLWLFATMSIADESQPASHQEAQTDSNVKSPSIVASAAQENPTRRIADGGDLADTSFAKSGKLLVFKNFSRGEEKIEAALSQTTTAEFPANPLRDVLDFLSQQWDIPIHMDRIALKGANVKEEDEVSLVIEEVTFRNALELMLADVNGSRLVPLIDNGALLITTPEIAEKHYETRIYDIRPLHVKDPDKLVEVVKSCTIGRWGDDWVSVNHGPDTRVKRQHGRVAHFQGNLIVLQTQAVHEEIEAMLNEMARLEHAFPDSKDHGVSPTPNQ